MSLAKASGDLRKGCPATTSHLKLLRHLQLLRNPPPQISLRTKRRLRSSSRSTRSLAKALRSVSAFFIARSSSEIPPTVQHTKPVLRSSRTDQNFALTLGFNQVAR